MQEANAGLATSLVFHALAALALGRMAWPVKTPAPAPPRPEVVWLGEWAQLPAKGRQEGANPVDSEQAAPRLAPAPSAERGAGDPPVAAADAPRAQTGPREEPGGAQPQRSDSGIAVDWAEARRRAIDDVLEERDRAASYRSFSFPGTLDEEEAHAIVTAQERIEAGLAPSRTAFDSPAKGRAGLSETTPLGEHIVWVSDECYAKYGTNNLFLLPPAAGLFDVPMTTCVRVHARADLFRNAKPRYLMTPVEHAAAARRYARSDDTGAAATFGD